MTTASWGVNSIALSMLPIEVIAEGGNVAAVAVGAAHTATRLSTTRIGMLGQQFFRTKLVQQERGPFWRPNPVTIRFRHK